MKFSFAFSILALLVPLAVEAAIVPESELVARLHRRALDGFGGFGGFDGGRGGKKGGQQASSSAASSTAAATSTTASAADAASSTISSVAAATSSAATGGNEDPQSSTTLDPSVIMKGLASDGQETPQAGQVPSLTSTNNFINFCLTQPNLPLTNGQQIITGSCNQTPMGVIVAKAKMPSSKFVNPKNGDTIPADQQFTIKMAISNLETGNFVNAQANYYAAPAQVNSDGVLIGHSHVVVEQLSSLDQTTPTDPTKFAFFKGLNAAAQNGILTADVTSGLPAGVYRLGSINTAANHQPALVAVAQHGTLDDQIYFTVGDNAAASNTTGTGDTSAATTPAAESSSTASTPAATASSTTPTGQGRRRRNGRNSRGRRDVLAHLS